MTVSAELWETYDVVMYSPTITAGISFDIPNVFQNVFGYFTSSTANAYTCSQMLFRVRHPIDANIYTHINQHMLSQQKPTWLWVASSSPENYRSLFQN